MPMLIALASRWCLVCGLFLAQSGRSASMGRYLGGRFYYALGAALLIIVLAGMAGWMVLARSKRPDDVTSVPPAGFSVEDLRQMHEQGELSDEEYVRAHRAVMARLLSKFDPGEDSSTSDTQPSTGRPGRDDR
ncbi:MAG: SHOCT domain-containing protein [Phycisphaeraceae bacterium]|nr:SHOCT domain-containing protein [Phycisphaeraceae bacterium]